MSETLSARSAISVGGVVWKSVATTSLAGFPSQV
jgi:hypothetical protein